MTNRAGHSHRRPHCSLCPDGPWNKSAQAEANFQDGEVQAAPCLRFSRDITQAPALNGDHSCLRGGRRHGSACPCTLRWTCVCGNTAFIAPDRRDGEFAGRDGCRETFNLEPDPSSPSGSSCESFLSVT